VNPYYRIEDTPSAFSVWSTDYEIYDFLEDLFVESDCEPVYVTHGSGEDPSLLGLHFDVSRARDVLSILASIPLEELERIWPLNNPPKTS